MMKSKKLLAGILSAVMLLVTAAVPAFADESTTVIALGAADTQTGSFAMLEAAIEVAAAGQVKIGETGYESLEAAMNSLSSRTGDVVITLTGTVNYEFGAWEGFTKNYAGGTITFEGTDANKGTVLNLHGTNSDHSAISNATTLIFKNLTINKTNANDNGGAAWNRHALNFEGGVEFENVDVNTEVAVGGASTFKNVNFTETNAQYTLWIKSSASGEIVVDGCTFTATNGGRGIKIADQYVKASNKVNLTVKNSTFNTASKAAVLVTSAEGADITAYGNDISNVTADSTNLVWIDEDKAYADSVDEVIVRNENGKIVNTIKVESGDSVTKTAFAEVNGKEYVSLCDALAAAKDGDTVTLCKNATGSGVQIPSNFADKGLTIDLGGHTYSVSAPAVGSPGTITNGFQILDNNKVTIKNGTINVADGNTTAMHLIQNYADLTIEDVTLDGTKLNNTDSTQPAYTLSHQGAALAIKGNSQIIAAESNAYAFDVSAWGSYRNATVTLEEGTSIVGEVEIKCYDGNDFDLKLTDANGNTYTAEGVYKAESNGTFTLQTDLFKKVLCIFNMDVVQDTNDESVSYYPLRFYAGIDSLDYKEVGFNVTAKKIDSESEPITKKLSTTKVYSKVKTSSAEYTAEDVGGAYIFGCSPFFTVGEWTNANTVITVEPYAVTEKGNTIKGEAKIISDKIIKESNSNMSLFKETTNATEEN